MKNFLEKVQENRPAGRKKDNTERAKGLGRKTREEIVKWNQMTAPRFQIGGRGVETSDIPGLLLGVVSGVYTDVHVLMLINHQLSIDPINPSTPPPYGEYTTILV